MSRFSSLNVCAVVASMLAVLIITSHSFGQAVVHVDGDNGSANPPGQGNSWAEAYKYLQDGLEQAEFLSGQPGNNTVEIWVAASTEPYNPWDTAGDPMDTLTDPAWQHSSTFQLRNNVHIYGGFAGYETQLDERDPEANETVLSGEIEEQTTNCFSYPHGPGCDQPLCSALVIDADCGDVCFCRDFEWDQGCAMLACGFEECLRPSDRAWHVVTAGPGITSDARLNGFTIRDGYAISNHEWVCPQVTLHPSATAGSGKGGSVPSAIR